MTARMRKSAGATRAAIVAVGRLIKLVANITKMLSYPFHALFPKKRFTLPAYAPPLWKQAPATAIPRTLWQTNFTDRVTLPVYLNYLFNRLMAPRFEYRFMVTQARHTFIERHFDPRVVQSYTRLQIGAAQADFWRLLVLYHHGGVYMDIDAHAIWPLSRVVGTENRELFVTTRRGDISNYFIASQAKNPHLLALIEQVQRNIETGTQTNVFELTGPGVFNQHLDKNAVPTVPYRYACHQGSFTNEHFQYLDKKAGKWTREQTRIAVVAPEAVAKDVVAPDVMTRENPARKKESEALSK
ncbi:glycosyltransferase family 32 protein [Vreelandella sp. EE22]